MLWKRRQFELGDDEQDIQLDKLFLFVEKASYSCQVRRDVDTVRPRNNGCQGTNKFYLLLADFPMENKKKCL